MSGPTLRVSWTTVLASGWSNIVAGALIYVLGRTETLLVFKWLSAIGLEHQVHASRLKLQPVMQSLPDFVLFSYPDGAWVFGFVCHMAWVWRNRPGREASLWTSVGPVLGLGGEVGQLVGLVPGTFDPSDIIATVGMWGMALLLVRQAARSNETDARAPVAPPIESQ